MVFQTLRQKHIRAIALSVKMYMQKKPVFHSEADYSNWLRNFIYEPNAHFRESQENRR
jgi:hypothetical protein